LYVKNLLGRTKPSTGPHSSFSGSFQIPNDRSRATKISQLHRHVTRWSQNAQHWGKQITLEEQVTLGEGRKTYNDKGERKQAHFVDVPNQTLHRLPRTK